MGAFEIFKKIFDYILLIRRSHPEIKDEDLEENGKIIYANGNDGTDFDWNCNDRMCELMVYFRDDGPKDGMGFIKVFVYKSGKVESYVYADGGMHPTEKPPVFSITKEEAAKLAASMYFAADKKSIWDRPVDEINLLVDPPAYLVDDFINGYYEEDEEDEDDDWDDEED